MPGSFQEPDLDAGGITPLVDGNGDQNAMVNTSRISRQPPLIDTDQANVPATGTLQSPSPASPGPSTSPTLDSQSGAVLPISRSSSFIQAVHVAGIPEHAQLSQFQAFPQFQEPKVASRRLRTVLQDRETAATLLYEHDKAILLRRAVAYERQLQEVTAAHAVTQKEMRATIDDHLREMSTLRSDLLEKNSTIEEIELRCDKLTAALALVQEELKGERERSEAQRQQEMQDLEARMMRSIQVRHLSSLETFMPLRSSSTAI